jgi:hypothetical protein
MNDPPIATRVEEGRVLLDLRTVFPEQDEKIGKALKHGGACTTFGTES